MADSSLLPEASDIAKVGSGLGVGGILATVLARAFSGQDAVLARLDKLKEDVTAVKTELAVLNANSTRRDADITTLQREVQSHGRTISRLEVVIAKLGVKVDADGS